MRTGPVIVRDEPQEVEMCPAGLHPMVGDNVYEWHGTGPRGKPRHVRRCRACQKETRRRYDARRKGRGIPTSEAEEHGPLDDLDVAILRVLPDEGAKLGKYLADSRHSGQLQKILDDAFLTPSMIGRRLAEMRNHGLVVAMPHKTHGGGARIGYQRTSEGAKVAAGEE